MAEEDRPSMVSLNEILDLLGSVSGENLRMRLAAAKNSRFGCDTDCGCHNYYCACHGTVEAGPANFTSVTEFLRLRESRVAELREQLNRLKFTPEQLAALEYKPGRPEGEPKD